MKNLHLFLLSSSVAFACVASRTFAMAVWSSDGPTSFALTICGTGPIGGGDFASPSGRWEFEDSVDVSSFSSPLQLQQYGSSVEFAQTGEKDIFSGYYRFDYRNGDTYTSGNAAIGCGDALPGWSIDDFITYKVANPHNPNTWQWTVECYGSGPDLTDSGCKSHEPCPEPAVPEPGPLWLVGVGLCGLVFAFRHGVGGRTQN